MIDRRDEPGQVQLFKEEFIRRLTEPRKYLTYVFYFGFVIIVLAGLGWIIPLGMMLYYGVSADHREFTSFSQSLSTYAIALAATAFVDLIISKDDPKISKRPFKNLFSMAVMFAFVIVVALAFWTFSAMSMTKSFVLTVVATVIALGIWWIANGDNAQYMEEPPPPNAATGGDPKRTADSDSSSLEGGLN